MSLASQGSQGSLVSRNLISLKTEENGILTTTAPTAAGPFDMEANKKCSNGLPFDNSVYNKKEYWDQRYTHEREFDWLGDFSGFKDLFLSHAPLSAYRDAKV